jgi:hypothetical protein
MPSDVMPTALPATENGSAMGRAKYSDCKEQRRKEFWVAQYVYAPHKAEKAKDFLHGSGRPHSKVGNGSRKHKAEQ